MEVLKVLEEGKSLLLKKIKKSKSGQKKLIEENVNL